MALLLYDNPNSGNALKVRFLMRDLGLEWETHEVPLSRPRPAWYLKLNALGGVPTLDDNGFVLTESNTILRYLAQREGRVDLYPDGPRERARVDEFLDRWSATLRPALKRYETTASQTLDATARAAVATEIGPILTTLETLLDPGAFALGDLTLADFAAAPALHRSIASSLDLSPFPTIAAWRAAVLVRPALRLSLP